MRYLAFVVILLNLHAAQASRDLCQTPPGTSLILLKEIDATPRQLVTFLGCEGRDEQDYSGQSGFIKVLLKETNETKSYPLIFWQSFATTNDCTSDLRHCVGERYMFSGLRMTAKSVRAVAILPGDRVAVTRKKKGFMEIALQRDLSTKGSCIPGTAICVGRTVKLANGSREVLGLNAKDGMVFYDPNCRDVEIIATHFSRLKFEEVCQ